MGLFTSKKELKKWANKYKLWRALHSGEEHRDCRYCPLFSYEVPGIPTAPIYGYCSFKRLMYDVNTRMVYMNKDEVFSSDCIEWIKHV